MVRCCRCGTELKRHELPQNRDDPATCDTCARTSIWPNVQIGKPKPDDQTVTA